MIENLITFKQKNNDGYDDLLLKKEIVNSLKKSSQKYAF